MRATRFSVLKHQVVGFSSNDLRGHRIRSLNNGGLNLSPTLEVLDLSFNDFKGPGFEPLENCKALQVLAASKNKISTLKGFPYYLLLSGIKATHHLRAHCAWDGDADSTFHFLLEQWKEQLPQGFLLKEAFIHQPVEEDACYCHFNFVMDETESTDTDVNLKYQWFIGDRTPSNFLEIHGAMRELYWPKHEDIGRILKVECTPKLGETEYPTIFSISSPVSPGTPRLLSLRVAGTAVEGTTLSVEKKYWGSEEGDSFYRWFRTSSSGTNIEVNDGMTFSYKLSIDDIGSFISVSCEPVRNDWARGPIVISEQVGPIVPGPPTCHSLEFQGSLIEGDCMSFIASYNGGEKGECLHEWFRVNYNGVKEKISSDGRAIYCHSL
ncbi:hypothetical protein FXO37_33158 [Capsicum annuum]|nr:hypothetical protein FXO37_33158 [Capsicum annuum]